MATDVHLLGTPGTDVKSALLAGTVVIGAALAGGPACADGVTLGTGGFFEETYMSTADGSENALGDQGSSTGFGELRVSSGDALANACVVPPGGAGILSAFGPDPWRADTAITDTACAGVNE